MVFERYRANSASIFHVVAGSTDIGDFHSGCQVPSDVGCYLEMILQIKRCLGWTGKDDIG
jgi:hypothetical protein